MVLDRLKVNVRSTGSKFVTVLYLATLEGVIHKLVVFPAGVGNGDEMEKTSVCLVEAINVSERPRPGLVRSLQLHTAKVCNTAVTRCELRLF